MMIKLLIYECVSNTNDVFAIDSYWQFSFVCLHISFFQFTMKRKEASMFIMIFYLKHFLWLLNGLTLILKIPANQVFVQIIHYTVVQLRTTGQCCNWRINLERDFEIPRLKAVLNGLRCIVGHNDVN